MVLFGDNHVFGSLENLLQVYLPPNLHLKIERLHNYRVLLVASQSQNFFTHRVIALFEFVNGAIFPCLPQWEIANNLGRSPNFIVVCIFVCEAISDHDKAKTEALHQIKKTVCFATIPITHQRCDDLRILTARILHNLRFLVKFGERILLVNVTCFAPVT